MTTAVSTAGIGGLGLVAALAVLVLPVMLLLTTRAPVGRARVARFARRQRLEITPDNGNQVIAYLATTRRWRVAGVLAAYLLGLGWLAYGVWEGNGEWSTLPTLLAGWFLGAVAAEARLARRPSGQRRAASLRPRDPATYLSWPARVALPAALATSLAAGGLTLFAAAAGPATGPDPDRRTAVVALAAALAVTALVRLVQRRVLHRPQPAGLAPDQRAADDAIRSRSLHVLAGAGAALVLYAAGYQLHALRDAYPAASAEIDGGTFLLGIVAPLLGWLVATTPWSVRPPLEPGPPAATPDTSGAAGTSN